MKAFLDACAQQENTTILIFSCPYCCKGREGIKSPIPGPASKAVLAAICSEQGLATQCPNCGNGIVIQADDKLRGEILASLDIVKQGLLQTSSFHSEN